MKLFLSDEMRKGLQKYHRETGKEPSYIPSIPNTPESGYFDLVCINCFSCDGFWIDASKIDLDKMSKLFHSEIAIEEGARLLDLLTIKRSLSQHNGEWMLTPAEAPDEINLYQFAAFFNESWWSGEPVLRCAECLDYGVVFRDEMVNAMNIDGISFTRANASFDVIGGYDSRHGELRYEARNGEITPSVLARTCVTCYNHDAWQRAIEDERWCLSDPAFMPCEDFEGCPYAVDMDLFNMTVQDVLIYKTSYFTPDDEDDLQMARDWPYILRNRVGY